MLIIIIIIIIIIADIGIARSYIAIEHCVLLESEETLHHNVSALQRIGPLLLSAAWPDIVQTPEQVLNINQHRPSLILGETTTATTEKQFVQMMKSAIG